MIIYSSRYITRYIHYGSCFNDSGHRLAPQSSVVIAVHITLYIYCIHIVYREESAKRMFNARQIVDLSILMHSVKVTASGEDLYVYKMYTI